LADCHQPDSRNAKGPRRNGLSQARHERPRATFATLPVPAQLEADRERTPKPRAKLIHEKVSEANQSRTAEGEMNAARWVIKPSLDPL